MALLHEAGPEVDHIFANLFLLLVCKRRPSFTSEFNMMCAVLSATGSIELVAMKRC